MRFVVDHRTCYRYDVPVTLGPHVVRLTPRAEHAWLLSHAIHVTPEPVQRRVRVDAHGNQLTELHFEGTCQELRIDSAFELETQPLPELRPPLPALPWRGDAPAADAVGADAPPDPTVRAFAEQLLDASGGEALGFLDRLNDALYSGFDRHIRPSGDANAPAETLASRRGACRDLAVLFQQACRAVGMVSRFVSGYQAQRETVDGKRHLHAWPEVLVPGVGFRGWDPTHGVRVGEGHVALCAAPEQAATMPVEGGFSFIGPGVTSTLDFSLRIQTT